MTRALGPVQVQHTTLHLLPLHTHTQNAHANGATHKQTHPSYKRYELCTARGLHVVGEANAESHGFDARFEHDASHPAHHAAWLPAMLERATR